MKKIILGVIIVVVVLTLAVVLISASGNRIDVNSFSVSKLENKTTQVSGDVKAVNLKVRTASVNIKKGTQNKIEFQNIVPDQFEVQVKSGKLNLIQHDYAKHHLEVGKSAAITIVLKNSTDIKKLQVDQLNGTLKLNNLTTDNLLINHVNGTTLSNDLNVRDSGKLVKKNGKTSFTKFSSPGLKASVKTGTFKLNGTKKSNDYNDNKDAQFVINSGSGQVSVTTK
ncbi:hypothetical protein [Companilactobacillus mishanensis]|uniref:DUF4097 domain-containing protein n=1 Tax=Companilactobacillus mishanensis TaxID=2486008 RepID=A0ABW9P896_9LACO|nr:hypothetical protein [Companilactobacillus mishanensis]MQS45446.1 hypothetical protein [Companilactobacillus mishanensis]